MAIMSAKEVRKRAPQPNDVLDAARRLPGVASVYGDLLDTGMAEVDPRSTRALKDAVDAMQKIAKFEPQGSKQVWGAHVSANRLAEIYRLVRRRELAGEDYEKQAETAATWSESSTQTNPKS